MRAFGIDARISPDIAADVAVSAQDLGYEAFWVNGSPHEGALDIIERVAERTDLDVGVGVFPLTAIAADRLATEVGERDVPRDRLWLGVGSGRRRGALAEVRTAVATLRTDFGGRVAVAAVGPRMTELAGEIADAVVFTWFMASDVVRAGNALATGAARADRSVPLVVSYIRCALLPGAAAALTERAAAYDAIPRYHRVFMANGMTAADTVVTGSTRRELLAGIEREAAVLDVPVIRAIPATDTVDALTDLVVACAP